MGSNRVIGKDNKMPWHLPADLKRFKALTLGHWVVMGRKTFESIGKPLPGRTNAVITRNPESIDSSSGILVVHSLNALENFKILNTIFIIGGAEIYEQTLPMADMLYVTRIDHDFPGDAFFPEIRESDWELIESVKGNTEGDAFPYRFQYLTYKKIN